MFLSLDDLEAGGLFAQTQPFDKGFDLLLPRELLSYHFLADAGLHFAQRLTAFHIDEQAPRLRLDEVADLAIAEADRILYNWL